jgi:hypothetical protein
MPATQDATPLTFDQFWRWLLEHRNCMVRAGGGDHMLFDADPLHWEFFDEPDGRAIVQLILGKTLVGELVLERGEVLFVQATADVENPQSGQWLFECIGGPRDDSYPLYSFVMSHGMEQVQGHQALKH